MKRLQAIPEGGGRKDLPPELQLDCHKGHDGHYDIYGRMWWDRLAPTLTSGCTNVTRGRFGHPQQDRAITLREAMLLQGFADTAVLKGGAEAMALQVGNAVPPPLSERIGYWILEMERASRSLSAGPGPLTGGGHRVPPRAVRAAGRDGQPERLSANPERAAAGA